MPAKPDTSKEKSPVRKKAGAGVGGGSTRRSQRRAPKAPPEAFRQVGEEVLNNNFDPGCWAQALAISDGGHDEAVAHYARIRTKALAKQKEEEQERHEEFEARRMHFCTHVAERPAKPAASPPSERFAVRMIDAFFWHTVGVVALAGAVLALQVLWPQIGPWWSLPRMVMVVAGLQLIPVVGWLAGRGCFRSLTYAQTAQFSASLAVVMSLFLGAHLLVRPGATEAAIVRTVPPPATHGPPAPKAEVHRGAQETRAEPLAVRDD